MKIVKTLCCLLLLVPVASVRADDEVSPSPYVAASGGWYAKCFPAPRKEGADYFKADREAGETLVYLLGAGANGWGYSESSKWEDKLVYRFDWYSPKIYLTGYGGGFTVVRMGPPPRGREPSKKDLALAFYRDGALLQRYSTLDLVGKYDSRIDLMRAKKIQVSVSHYTVIKEVVGFVSIYRKVGSNIHHASPAYGFEIILEDGSHRVFDIATGKRLVLSEDEFTKRNPHM